MRLKKLKGCLWTVLLTLIVIVGLTTAAVKVGFTSIDEISSRFPQGLSFLQRVGDAAQIAIDQGTSMVSQLADHIQPSGEGNLLQGELPEDRLAETEQEYYFTADLYPYRAMLQPDGQTAYDQIYANAMALYDQFPLHTEIPVSSLSDVMSAVFYDHPELFWLETSYQYSYNTGNEVVAVTLDFNEAADDIEAFSSRFDTVVNQVVAGARQLPNPVEQEKYVHDFLLDNVTYRLDAPLNQSAYSAIVNGESVCAGYARAFQHIMLELEISVYYCTGFAGDSHAWNIIQLDGEFYHVDVGWDDPLGNTTGKRYYNYFNLTDDEIEKDHAREGMSVSLPACNGTKYRYDNYFGAADDSAGSSYYNTIQSPEAAGLSRDDAFTTLDSYYNFCAEKLKELGTGTHTFTVLVEDKSLVDAIFDQLDSDGTIELYVKPAAASLGLNGYRAHVSLQAQSLSDGYWQVTQQIQLEE